MPEINHNPPKDSTKTSISNADNHAHDGTADEEASQSEGADKPRSSGPASSGARESDPHHRHDSDASTKTVKVPQAPHRSQSALNPLPQHPAAPNRSKSHSIKRMFRMESSTKLEPSAPANSKAQTPKSVHSPGRQGQDGLPTVNSVSPTSTLPTPPSEATSPPTSQPPSRSNSIKSKGGRRLSFTGIHKGIVADKEAGRATPGAVGGADTPRAEGRFTLKDLLQPGPKLNRRPSEGAPSSRRSDASSDRGGNDVTSTGTSLLKKYGVCERIAIGKGATSVVRLAHKWDRSEEKLYAVKEFRKRRKNETEKEYVKKLTAEFCISSTLHHRNVVETVDLVQDEAAHWCEVMEYCPGGDLYAAIKKGSMSPAEIECCFKQILCGVQYLHSQGVAHRDLKPENLFFDTAGHLKIGDYGASTVYRLPWEATVHMSTGLCGSEPYIAPEQFLGKPYDARLVDIWAVGIVFYCLICQELPWRAAQASDPLFSSYSTVCAQHPYKASISGSSTASNASSSTIGSGASTPSNSSSRTAASRQNTAELNNFPPTIQNFEPKDARPLLRRILEPDPKLRVNINEIMENPWLKSIEVCTEVEKPHHQHTNIRAALSQQAVVVERDQQ